MLDLVWLHDIYTFTNKNNVTMTWTGLDAVTGSSTRHLSQGRTYYDKYNRFFCSV